MELLGCEAQWIIYVHTSIAFFAPVCVGETFVTRKVTRSVAQIHLGHMESVSVNDMSCTHTMTWWHPHTHSSDAYVYVYMHIKYWQRRGTGEYQRCFHSAYPYTTNQSRLFCGFQLGLSCKATSHEAIRLMNCWTRTEIREWCGLPLRGVVQGSDEVIGVTGCKRGHVTYYHLTYIAIWNNYTIGKLSLLHCNAAQ